MKKIILISILLLVSLLSAEIQTDSSKNEFRIYENGTPRNMYFRVHESNVLIGSKNSEVQLSLDGKFYVGRDDTGYDVKFFGATASAYSLWDESLDRFVLEGADLKLNDDDYLLLGDATNGDVQQSWNGTYLELAPVSGFWADCPNITYPDASLYFHYFEDFIGHVNFPATSGAGGGWKLSGDATYDVLNAAGTIGGIIQLAAESGSNNELYCQLGTLGTETYMEYVKDSGKESWIEFRIAVSSITNAANWLVGLAEEGSAAANFIADSGDDIADKDVLGFVVWEGDPNAIDCIHQLSGGAFADPGLAGVPVANTYMTLGIYFDGAETVSFYYNGTAVQTADLDTATFPTDEELSPIIALKQGAADVTMSVDWIKIVAER